MSDPRERSAGCDGGDWHVYLIRTRDGALYTGIARDVERRLAEHEAGGRSAAKYLRAKRPLSIAYRARIGARGLALAVERRIKRLRKRDKEALVAAGPCAEALFETLALPPPG